MGLRASTKRSPRDGIPSPESGAGDNFAVRTELDTLRADNARIRRQLALRDRRST